MTLYDQAASNVRKTWLLLFIFLVFIIALGWIFSYLLGSFSILYGAVIFSILMSFGSYWWSDKIVLAMTKAQPIEKKDNPELYRLVENLCLTAGLPLPRIYVLPEVQPNAFATGRNKDHAVVAVTQGLLERLNRSELEGVIAHELSHIRNKDMLLQTMVVVLVGTIAIASHWFLRLGFFGGFGGQRRDRGGGGGILILIGIVAAILAPIGASLIKLAVSRKREFLADSSAALLTRYPEGLASALQKISSDPHSLRTASPSTAHLFIASPFRRQQRRSWLTKMFMTHPPVQDRIKALQGLEV